MGCFKSADDREGFKTSAAPKKSPDDELSDIDLHGATGGLSIQVGSQSAGMYFRISPAKIVEETTRSRSGGGGGGGVS
ncbi:hypothetical protein [Methylobacterium nonmethylotrophicum]|uniref:Uncharacterized protein n=1 Tax=Methylobacterium nonmethylotrophicum TaxID=1141884 RepID=A0A4Z0NDS4_9HYPH|nr:hypothetical protein [Methylobacterium nonmethylotrophicum]TGD91410.1 hypothetical protein EU555_35840 [Methylobacterium nonmethylotrophicum]